VLAAAEQPLVQRRVPQVCLPACRAVAQSAGSDVRPVVRVPAVDPVQEQPLVLLELRLVRAPLQAASRKDVHQAALEAGPEPAPVLRLAPVRRPEEARLAVHSALTQVRVAASHRAHPVR
jgi:hypothetical protein